MAAIAATDLTYTVENSTRPATTGRNVKFRNRVKIVFGDGSSTYPSGGIPLTKAKMGVPNTIASFVLDDDVSGLGYVWKFDRANEKLRAYVETTVATNQPLIETTTAYAPAASTTLYAVVEGY